MHIRILRSECCGNAQCVEIAPGAFALDSKNKAIVLDPESEDVAALVAAAESCPCSAIVVVNDDGEPLA